MPKIGSRLLEPEGNPEISEDFNRDLDMMKDAYGTPVKGIKSITGGIDISNKLTLTFTLTDDSTQTVEWAITPSAV